MAFISYDSYKNRIEKLAKFKNFVSKYKFLIMGVLAVILGGASALMATKGMITSDIALSADTYTYGDSYTPTAGTAFLSDVGYEYSVQGSNEWTEQKPVKVGKYSVRAVSNKLIGKGYGTPVDFEILPKKVEFAFGDETTLTYGDKPKKYGISELVLSDRIDVNGASFAYEYNDEAENFNEWTVDVTVAAGSVKIVDKNGNDSSDCYIYDTKKQTFALERRNMSVVLQNANETYRGEEISYKGELLNPNLAEGDSIDFDTEIIQNGSPAKLLNAGDYGIKVVDGSIKITKGTEDVTKRYNIGTPVNGKFTVKQRPLTITTADANRVYDGTALSNEGATPDNLVVGHTLSPVGTAPAITDAGTLINEREFIILDANDNPVSANYDYKYKYGTLTVTRRPLTITTLGGEWEYDGTARSTNGEYNLIGSLADGQSFVSGNYAKVTNYTSGTPNTLEYTIYDGNKDVTYNYAVTENFGILKISKRVITVDTGSHSFKYDGGAHSILDANIDLSSLITNGTLALASESLVVVQGTQTTVTNVDDSKEQNNTTQYTVLNGNGLESENYSVKYNYGTLTVTAREITVTFTAIESVPYGYTPFSEPTWSVGGDGLAFDESFKGAYFYDDAKPTLLSAGSHKVSIDKANCSFTRYGMPVSSNNYTITNDPTITLTVGTRKITVYLNDTTCTYGDELIYNLGNERVETLVEGQTLQIDASKVGFGTSAMPDAGTYTDKISCPNTAITVLSGNTPVTSNYDVTVEVSTLYINQRPITVHAKDILGVIYGERIDYTAAHNGAYKSITGDGLATGETLTINNVSYLRTNGIPVDPSDNPDVDDYKIKPSSVTIKKSNGDDSLLNYQITPADDGVLTIVERPITIQSATDLELIYDGTAQYNKGNKVTSELDKLSGHRIEVTDYTTVTDVSKDPVTNELKYKIKDSFNNDVTTNYAIKDDFGTIKVNPKTITVQLYTYDTYEAVYGEDYAYPTGAGNYKNTPDLVSGETLEITKVTYEFGYIKTPNVGKTAYWVKGDTFKVTKPSGAVGTGNYEVEWVDGSLKINPRHIRVTLKSDSVYYGSRGAYDVSNAGNYARATLLDLPSGNALVSGELLKITAVTYEYGAEQYPEVKEGGYKISQADYEITKGGENSKYNYEVEWEDGTLTILPRTVEIALNDIATVKYGEEVEYAGGYKSKSGVLDIHTVTVNAAAGDMSFTPDKDNATYAYPDAGTYSFTCNESFISITDASGKDAKHNYTVNVAKGNLEIDKREITVKPHSYEKKYGDNFNYSTVTLTPNYEKLTKGTLAVFNGEEEALVIFVDSLEVDGFVKKDVGKYPVIPNRYEVTRYDGHDSTNNYDVKFETGTLEITKREIEVELPYLSLEYGSDEYYGKSYAELYAEEIVVDTLFFGESLKFTVGFTQNGETASPKKSGFYNAVITKEEIVNSNGSISANGNYSITYTGGKQLYISTRQIEIIPDFVKITYGEEIVYTSGSSNFTYGTVGNNPIAYNMPKYGEELEISVKYAHDGKNPPSVGKYDVIVDTVTVHYKDGTSETLNCIYKDHSLLLGEVGGYSIIYTPSNFAEKLQITPKTLEVTLNDISAQYGDKIEYKSDTPEKAEGLLTEFGHELEIDPEGITFKAQGNAIYPNVGKYDFVTTDNKFIKVLNSDGDPVTDNYDIKVTKGGTLTITALEITLILEDLGEIAYGTEAPVPKITGTLPDDTVSGKFIYYNKTTSGYFDSEWLQGGENRYLTAGIYEVTLDEKSIVFEYANEAPADTQNYVVQSVLYANLKVTPRKITVELQPFERVYGQNNSDALTWQKRGNNKGLSYISDMDINDLISIDNLAGGDGVYSLTLSVYAKGTTDSVVCKDVGTYSVGLSALVFHYDGGSSQATQNYEYDLPAAVDFEITKYELKLEVGEKRALYGGESFILDYWSYRASTGLPFSEVVNVSAFALDGVTEYPADASETPYDLDPKVFTAKVDGGSADNYDISIIGTLKIEPRELEINLYSISSKVYYYGGTYDNLAKEEYISASGLVTVGNKTETLEVLFIDYGFNGAIPNASSTPYPVKGIECIVTKVDGVTPSTDNYSVKWVFGDLTIRPRPVTVTLQLVEDTIYYGDKLPTPEYEVKYGLEEGLVGSDKFHPEYMWRESGSNNYYNYGYDPLRGFVGEYGIILYQAQSCFTDKNGNKVENYEIVSDSVENEITLTISQRPIKVELQDITVEYGVFDSSDAFLVNDDIKKVLKTEEIKLAFDETFTYAKIQTLDGYTVMKNKGSYDVELVGLNVLRKNGSMDFIYGTNSNYVITEDSVLTATVTINAKKVDLDLGTYSFTYGEEEKFREKFTYIAKSPDLAFDETLTLKTFYAVDYPTDARLDAGDYTISADQASAVFSDEQHCQENYEVTFTGTLTVYARPVKAELLDFYDLADEYFYGDGENLVYPAYKGNYQSLIYYPIIIINRESKDGLVYGQQLQIAISWKCSGKDVDAPKDVGVYVYAVDEENSVIYDADGNEIANGVYNYAFDDSYGEVEIKAAKLDLQLEDFTIVYGDDLPYVPKEYQSEPQIEIPELNALLKYEGETIKVAIAYYVDTDWFIAGVVPEDADDYVYRIHDYTPYYSDGTEQTAENYDLTGVLEGKLHILQKPITVNTVNLPDVFYGEPVSYPDDWDDYCVVGGGLVEGQHIAITSVEYYDENGKIVDGVPTAVGIYYVVPTRVAICDDNGEPVNDYNYDITYPDPEVPDELESCGTIKIMPILLHLVTVDQTWEYDGKEHSDTGYTLWLVDDNGTVTDKHFYLTVGEARRVKVVEGSETTITNVGSTPNDVSYDFSKTNYEIASVESGTLTVTPRKIVVERGSATKTYDGDPLTCTVIARSYWVDENGNAILDGNGNEIVGLLNEKDTVHAVDGTVTELIRATTIDNQTLFEADSDNYEVVGCVGGTLTVTPRAITLVINGDSVTYGVTNPIGAKDFTYAEDSEKLVEGEELSIAVLYYDKSDASKTLLTSLGGVGTYGVVLDKPECVVTTNYDSENGFSNYDVDFVEGEVEVTQKEITVALQEKDKVYGEDFDLSFGYDIVEGELVGEDTLKTFGVSPDGVNERTSVGGYAIEIGYCTVNGEIFDEFVGDGVISAGNYKITFIGTTLNVTKRKIVAVAASAQKEGYYDGTPFSCTDYAGAYLLGKPEVDGIMYWDKIDEVLEYDNGANSVINAGEFENEAQFKSKSTNYEVDHTEAGKLTILKLPVTIILLEVEGQTYGTRLTYPDGTDGLNYGYADGSLEIVEGENLIVAVIFKNSEGKEADPKNADTYSYEWNEEGSEVQDSIGGAGIDNYDITCVDASEYAYSAEIEKLEVNLTLQGWDDIDYDGKTHEYDGGIDYEFPYDETMELGVDYYSVVDEVKTLMSGAPKNAGDYAVRYVESKTQIGGIAANINYVINISPDSDIPFTINALDITISMGAEEYPYDGKVYVYKDSNDNFEVSASVAGETIVPTVSYYEDEAFTLPATPKNAGVYFVKFEYFTVEGSNDLVENYNLLNTDAWCTLEITPKKIEIQALLDGNDFYSIERFADLPEEGFEHFTFVAEDLAYLTAEYSYGYRGEDGKATSTPANREEVNQTIGIYELSVSFKESTEGGNVLGNYEITENLPAKLEVTARRVTVEAVYNGATRPYDGKPLNEDDFDFIHWHADDKTKLGFYDDYVPEYELLFTKDGEQTTDLPVNAGTYTVNLRFTNVDPTEYLVTNSTTPISVTITKRRLVATANYDANEFKDITYSFDSLPTSITVTNTDEYGDIGIIKKDVEGGVAIAWYFYNTTMSEEVVYNYAGNYQIRFRLVGGDENYEITNPNAGGTFAVNKAVLYVTPNDVTEQYYYEGQKLMLGEDDFTVRIGDLQSNDDLGVTDVLKITGSSGENRNVRTKKVTITQVQITQDGKDVTSSYEVHFRYETGSDLPASEFEANLTFIPVVIKYKQTSLNGGNPLMLEYTGKTHDLSPYVNKSNLSSYIEITEGSFVGSCTLTYNLVTIQRWAGDYEKWIQIMVRDSHNVLLNGLYDFQLQNASESKVVVYGDYIDFELDAGCDFTDVTASSYKGYDVLNSGYTLSGLVDGSHNFEVLTRLENGVRVIKIIIYTNGENGRVDASYRYSISPTSSNPVSVKVTQISQIIASTTIN